MRGRPYRLIMFRYTFASWTNGVRDLGSGRGRLDVLVTQRLEQLPRELERVSGRLAHAVTAGAFGKRLQAGGRVVEAQRETVSHALKLASN